MRSRRVLTALVLLLLGVVDVNAKTKEEKQAEARKKSEETLASLYKAKPSAQLVINASVGYAIFTSRGGQGDGIAVDRMTQKVTYMKLAQIRAGLGVKNFSVFFVFETKDALDQFLIEGWDFGGPLPVGATDGLSKCHGASWVAPGVWIYQLTEKGITLEFTARGTKYLKDSNLN